MSIYHLDYRPKDLADLDIPSVRDILEKVFKDNKETPRAFLFCGPKGSGKTSAARVVARKVNNISSEDTKMHIDILELDGASNRGIDDMRALREKAYLMPAELPKKVFIIDEVHMLTKEAFNALLKILEEPPKHVVFILCTTDPDDIPDTVLSRLFRVDFRKASKEEILLSLQKIVTGEKLKITDEILSRIYEKSEGSFRNAAKILNELTISGKDPDEFFANKWGNYSFIDFEEDLLSGDSRKILQTLEAETEAGVDMEAFTVGLLSFFQKQLLTTSLLAERLNPWLNLLLNACRQTKDSPIAQLPLQLAVAEFLKDQAGEVKSAGAAVAPNVVAEKDSDGKDVIMVVSMQNVGDCTLEEVNTNWLKLLTEVGMHNRSVSAFLKASKPVKLDGGELVLEVFYDFHKQQLQEIRNRQLVENCLELILGKRLNLVFSRSATSLKKVVVDNQAFLPPPEIVMQEKKVTEEDALYDVAKEIFG